MRRLTDGRLVLLAGRGEACRLLLFDSDGSLLRTFQMANAQLRRLVGPSDDQRTILVVWSSDADARAWSNTWRATALDLDSGQTRQYPDHLYGISSPPDPRTVIFETLGKTNQRWFRFDSSKGEIHSVFGEGD